MLITATQGTGQNGRYVQVRDNMGSLVGTQRWPLFRMAVISGYTVATIGLIGMYE